MPLSQPNNPPTVNPAVIKPVSSGNLFGSLVARTQVNQIKGINPNNASGSGIPKQVSNVQVSIANAQTGATCTVTVLFRRDSTDTAFSGINVWVRGYQGNGQYVQVASGSDSPTKFVLNNTGETVSFTIQAFGNGGNAPLSQSPTSSAVLPKSTTGGFGSSTINYYNVNNPPGGGLTLTTAGQGYFYGPGFGPLNPTYGNTVTSTTVSSTINQITAFQFYLPYSITINRVSIQVQTAVAASTVNFGIYNATGTTKLLDSGAFSAATTGNKSAAITPVTLNPGVYYFAQSSSSAGVQVVGVAPSLTVLVQQLNASNVKVGQSPNLTSGGVMPASLGVLVADTLFVGVCMPLFEV